MTTMTSTHVIAIHRCEIDGRLHVELLDGEDRLGELVVDDPSDPRITNMLGIIFGLEGPSAPAARAEATVMDKMLDDWLQAPMTIAGINASPMESLRYEDFRALRPGRDDVSRMRANEVMARISDEDRAAIEEAVREPQYRLSAMRWMLRGLDLDKAIRKAQIDQPSALRAPRARQVTP